MVSKAHKLFTTLCFLALLTTLALLAQEGPAEPVTFDLAVVFSILATGIAGIPVAGLCEMLKRLLGWKDGRAYIIAFVVSGACVAAYIFPLGLFSWQLFAGYTIIVFGEASGLYKMVKKPKPE